MKNTTEETKALLDQIHAKKEAIVALMAQSARLVLNLDQQDIVNTAEMLLKESGKAVLTGGPNDIGKKTFEDYVKEWANFLKKELKRLNTLDLLVKKSDFITFFDKQIGSAQFPVTNDIVGYINAEIKGLKPKDIPKSFADAIEKGLNKFLADYNFTEAYETNEDIYRPIKKKNLDEKIIDTNTFYIKFVEQIEKSQGKAVKEDEAEAAAAAAE